MAKCKGVLPRLSAMLRSVLSVASKGSSLESLHHDYGELRNLELVSEDLLVPPLHTPGKK